MITHEPCKFRGDCYHVRGGRNIPYEAKVRGGRNGLHEAKVYAGRNGMRKMQATWGKTPEAYEVRIRARRNGGHKTQATWGKTPEAYEARARGARNQPREARVRAGHNGGRANVENGQLARISRGVPSTADGILFHSQTEVMFYCTMKELGGEPHAYPPRIKLPNGRSYFPDSILGHSIFGIPANVPIELKPARNAFYNENLPKAIEAGAFVVYWDELVEK